MSHGGEPLSRLEAEAPALARLHHANIVQIFEVGQYAGIGYVALEYVAGQDLDEQLSDGRMPPREAAEMPLVVSQSMHLTHQRGILYRDLKPRNILIDAHSTPRITDFGLAARTHSP